MNSYERFSKRLRGEPVDRSPNFDIMMTFAAHYIGQPLSRYYRDYNVEIEENLGDWKVGRLKSDILPTSPYI